MRRSDIKILEITIHLIQASNEKHWDIAESILKEVALDLDLRGRTLWLPEQIEKSELRKCYQLEELFLLTDKSNVFGIVFIQSYDPLFWPEVQKGESLFLHKLAVLPKYRNKGFGYKIIACAINLAKSKNIDWVRLDCDIRPELTAYYEKFGFSLVNKLRMGKFNVARYQLLAKEFIVLNE